MAIMNRLSKMWNAFRSYEENPVQPTYSIGPSTSARPHATRPRYSNERSIVASIYTRIAIDFAEIGIRHVKLDDQDRYMEDVDSSLNRCFTLEANIDQGPRAFKQDIAMSLFDDGAVAIVPVDITIDPNSGNMFEIDNMRVGKIIEWYPKHVRVSLYNEAKGIRQEIIVEKKNAAIIENPLYSVMNERNSTLQRLIHKLNLLDVVDEQSSSGKLDLIIQLPYVIKSDARRQQAERRREDIEFQLKGSQYGIAYTDGTEKITQLNRPAENNLLGQIEYLTKLLYSQLGITEEVMNGTADEATMINYYNRTIEPLLEATVEAMQRSFLGDDKTSKKERIKYFRDPFKLIPLSQIAEVADKFARNEIMTSNEIRAAMGIPPHPDPKADLLVNSNMPQSNINIGMPGQDPAAPPPPAIDPEQMASDMDAIMNEVFDGLTSDINTMAKGLQ